MVLYKGRSSTDRALLIENAVPETTNTEVNGAAPAPAVEDGVEQAPEGMTKSLGGVSNFEPVGLSSIRAHSFANAV